MDSERFGTAIKRSDLFGGRVLSCVDGRSVGAVVGTPGGTLGELILTASAIEIVLGRELSQVSMNQLMAGMVDDGGAFYHHTDRHSLNELSLALASEGIDEHSSDELLEWLKNPNEEARESLLDSLVVPEHIGCGHIAAMLIEPDAYGTRRELVVYALRSFFGQLWSGSSSIHYVALSGTHMESEVLNITGDSDRVLPAFTVTGRGHTFVFHRDDIAWFRGCVSKLVNKWLGIELAADILSVELERLGKKQLEATLSRLAGGLPVVETRDH